MNYNNTDFDTLRKIQEVLYSKKPIDSYIHNFRFQNSCYALFLDGAVKTNLAELDIRKSIGTYSLVQIGDLSQGAFFDRNVVQWFINEHLKGTKNYNRPQKFTQIVGFDSNMFSNIRRTLKNPSIDPDCYKMLMYIKEKGVYISPEPNVYEHAFRLNAMRGGFNSILESLKYYYAFQRLSLSELNYLTNQEIRIIEDDDINGKRLVEKIKAIHDKPESWPSFGVEPIYCLLLETNILKWSLSWKKKPVEAFEELFRFVNQDLCVYLEDVLLFCVKYLHNSNDKDLNKFFGKMNIGSKHLLQGIESIAWDFWHILSMPLQMARYYAELDVPNIYSIVTRDKGMIDAINFNPIRRIVVYGDRTYLKYEHDIKELDYLPKELIKSLDSNAKYRKEHLQHVDFNKIAKEKERELLSLV